MKPSGYDFCGWVTKNDVLCKDGRTIMKDAFAHQDGEKVPMVYMHDHQTTDGICGYTILENRPEGVYGYSYCNNSNSGKNIKEAVRHGDVNSYSIYADGLKEKSKKVMHGVIKEVSIVLSGANKKATIEETSMAHYDEEDNIMFNAIILPGADSEFESNSAIEHSDNDEKESKEMPTESEDTNENKTMDKETVKTILKTYDKKQLAALAYLIGDAVARAKNGELDDEDYDEEEVEHSDINT